MCEKLVKIATFIFRLRDMGKPGAQCSAFGCNKRKRACSKPDYIRSESEGSADEETAGKRKVPRTFFR